MNALLRKHSATGIALLIATSVCMSALPLSAKAQSLEVSGWIPYWASKSGANTAIKNMDAFTEINPFAYSVTSKGTLSDTMKLTKSEWKKLFRAAEREDVRIIPTVMWSDRANIDRILRDPALRAAHVKAIVAEIEKKDFDGVDIDYENKSADTRPYFSLFLKDLKAALKGKMLACTIEARTPPDSLYRVVPANIEYANDYKEINKHCDRVRLMAYDQQTADWKLNQAAKGPYAPLSDVAWAKKVIDLAAKDISKDKLVLGIPTYGHEYEITVNPGGTFGYKKLWAFNPKYATDLAKKQKLTPVRASSGELSFAYIPKTSTAYRSKHAVSSGTTTSAERAIAQAQAYAKATGTSTTINMLWWSDAGSIERKLDLVAASGLKGVAIFKVDGGADSKMWRLF